RFSVRHPSSHPQDNQRVGCWLGDGFRDCHGAPCRRQSQRSGQHPQRAGRSEPQKVTSVTRYVSHLCLISSAASNKMTIFILSTDCSDFRRLFEALSAKSAKSVDRTPLLVDTHGTSWNSGSMQMVQRKSSSPSAVGGLPMIVAASCLSVSVGGR